VGAIRDVVGADNLATLDANRLADGLMGDTIYANVLMVGAAWQAGLVPVSLDALLRAIELNGIKIDENKRAFAWGRIAAHDPAAIEDLLGDGGDTQTESLDDMVARRADFLTDYQNDALARKYTAVVERVRDAESALSDDDALTRAVAQAYFRLLSYKDEYEVARLHTRKEFLDSIKRDYGEQAKLKFHLAPPLLGGKLDARGRPLKKEFGGWMLPVFRVLAGMRGLRGGPFDLFGYTAERRWERSLIREFEKLLDEIVPVLDADTLPDAIAQVQRYLEIRGFGPVKLDAWKALNTNA
jgi:indolepyruvate ferredoxin oxidoreductase